MSAPFESPTSNSSLDSLDFSPFSNATDDSPMRGEFLVGGSPSSNNSSDIIINNNSNNNSNNNIHNESLRHEQQVPKTDAATTFRRHRSPHSAADAGNCNAVDGTRCTNERKVEELALQQEGQPRQLRRTLVYRGLFACVFGLLFCSVLWQQQQQQQQPQGSKHQPPVVNGGSSSNEDIIYNDYLDHTTASPTTVVPIHDRHNLLKHVEEFLEFTVVFYSGYLLVIACIFGLTAEFIVFIATWAAGLLVVFGIVSCIDYQRLPPPPPPRRRLPFGCIFYKWLRLFFFAGLFLLLFVTVYMSGTAQSLMASHATTEDPVQIASFTINCTPPKAPVADDMPLQISSSSVPALPKARTAPETSTAVAIVVTKGRFVEGKGAATVFWRRFFQWDASSTLLLVQHFRLLSTWRFKPTLPSKALAVVHTLDGQRAVVDVENGDEKWLFAPSPSTPTPPPPLNDFVASLGFCKQPTPFGAPASTCNVDSGRHYTYETHELSIDDVGAGGKASDSGLPLLLAKDDDDNGKSSDCVLSLLLANGDDNLPGFTATSASLSGCENDSPLLDDITIKTDNKLALVDDDDDDDDDATATIAGFGSGSMFTVEFAPPDEAPPPPEKYKATSTYPSELVATATAALPLQLASGTVASHGPSFSRGTVAATAGFVVVIIAFMFLLHQREEESNLATRRLKLRIRQLLEHGDRLEGQLCEQDEQHRQALRSCDAQLREQKAEHDQQTDQMQRHATEQNQEIARLHARIRFQEAQHALERLFERRAPLQQPDVDMEIVDPWEFPNADNGVSDGDESEGSDADDDGLLSPHSTHDRSGTDDDDRSSIETSEDQDDADDMSTHPRRIEDEDDGSSIRSSRGGSVHGSQGSVSGDRSSTATSEDSEVGSDEEEVDWDDDAKEEEEKDDDNDDNNDDDDDDHQQDELADDDDHNELEDIPGVNYANLDLHFRGRLEELRTFLRDHGHLVVPSAPRHGYQSLYNWTIRQIRRRERFPFAWDGRIITLDEMRALDSLGFDWNRRRG